MLSMSSVGGRMVDPAAQRDSTKVERRQRDSQKEHAVGVGWRQDSCGDTDNDQCHSPLAGESG